MLFIKGKVIVFHNLSFQLVFDKHSEAELVDVPCELQEVVDGVDEFINLEFGLELLRVRRGLAILAVDLLLHAFNSAL